MEEFKDLEQMQEEELVTEELTEGAKPSKTYTEEEFNSKLDEIISKRLAREKAKIKREYDKQLNKYKEVETVLNVGMGTNSIEEATHSLKDFYSKKGIRIPDQTVKGYSEEEETILANAQAQFIIDGGYEELVEEVDRLANIGVNNMTPREKIMFTKLAEVRKSEESKLELKKIGVSDDVLNDSKFQEFKGMFDSKIPIKKVFEMYQKMNPSKQTQPIGSLKNVPEEKVKDYYTPEEARRLTSRDLDNPKVMEAVERSMTMWYNN